MLFPYIIIGAAIVLHIRFFILNSLSNKTARKSALLAAGKAIYFMPLFLQGLILLWISVNQFYFIGKDFFQLLQYWAYNKEMESPYAFIGIPAYICIGSLLLSLHFIVGKTSLDRKIDTSSISLKMLYLIASYLLLYFTWLNINLAEPLGLLTPGNYFLSDKAYIIITGGIIYIAVLLFSIFHRRPHKHFRYLQISVLTSAGYVILCMTVSLLFFLLYIIVNIIDIIVR